MEDVEGMETDLMMSVAVKILVFHQVSTDNKFIKYFEQYQLLVLLLLFQKRTLLMLHLAHTMVTLLVLLLTLLVI